MHWRAHFFADLGALHCVCLFKFSIQRGLSKEKQAQIILMMMTYANDYDAHDVAKNKSLA